MNPIRIASWLSILLTSTIWAQTITVTSPNGGETWTAGSTQTIRWTASGTFTDIFRVRYTTNGSTWTSIQTVANSTRQISWIVPNQPSTICKIRVEHYNAARSPQDDSNANFTIISGTPPDGQQDSLQLIAPNGGERWQRGSQHQITWDKFGAIPNVKLEYSLDFGSTWLVIAVSALNSGIYNWTLPDTTWPFAQVRISDARDGFPKDISSAVFSITRKARTGDIIVTWNKNLELDLGGYRVWWRTSAGQTFFNVVIRDTTITFHNLQPETYFFRLTAFDFNGNESDYSEEVFATIEDWPLDIDAPPSQNIINLQIKY